MRFAVNIESQSQGFIVGLCLTKEFNKIIEMDLKYWSDDPDMTLYIINHTTCYTVSCSIRSKKRTYIVSKSFSNSIFILDA